MFGMRVGLRPRVVITTTPRPIPIIRELIASHGSVVTRGRTADNAENLAPTFLKTVTDRYGGTRLGRQELNAEVLEDVPGALWQLKMFETSRFRVETPPRMARIVVAIDPSGIRGDDDENADSVGIVVAGKGNDGRGYVLADLTCRLSPRGWGGVAIDAYRRFGADRIIAERNYGGAMVEALLRSINRNIPYKEVVASRGKVVRAEPIAALYEQDRVSHIGPAKDFELLEAQMCAMTSNGFMANGSPDRVDALVWALSELMIASAGPLVISDEVMLQAARLRR